MIWMMIPVMFPDLVIQANEIPAMRVLHPNPHSQLLILERLIPAQLLQS